MVVIPPGKYVRGSDEYNQKPASDVSIRYVFAMAKYEVTIAEWNDCVRARACSGEQLRPEYVEYDAPMLGRTREHAAEYIAWINERSGLGYRLPTSSEWEYAGRAGTQTLYYWGDELGENNASCDGCGSDWDRRSPAPVGSFAPNDFGLYDMIGNAYEHVEDCWKGTYTGQPVDGSAFTRHDCRSYVLRGGAYNSDPQFLSLASRQEYFDNMPEHRAGIRVARDISP